MVTGFAIKKWCPVEEREVPYSEIKKGYETTNDQYIVPEKQDLLKTTNTIDITEFVDEEEMPIIIEKSYYFAPDNKNENDLHLLVNVPNRNQKNSSAKSDFQG